MNLIYGTPADSTPNYFFQSDPLPYGNVPGTGGVAGVGTVGYAGLQTNGWEGDVLNAFGGPVYASDVNLAPIESLINQPTPTPTPTGGTTGGTVVQQQPVVQQSGGNYMDYYQGWDQTQAQQDFQNAFGGDINKLMTARGVNSGSGTPTVDPYAQVRNDIGSGYDNYFQSLNDQLGALPGQVNSQNQIIDNSYGQGLNDLNLQQTQGDQAFTGQRGEITGNQNKNLKSIDENLRNMFMAGNVYLGSRGAGDSSAANQYSYALTKQGNQARGDQMTAATKAYSEVQGRETNLKNIVNNEMTKLKTNADNEKLKVGQWFADAQNQVKTAIANGQLNKSTDLANLSKSILDQAMQKLQTSQTDFTNKQNSLISWAENNSKSIGELKTNIQTVLAQAPQLMGGSQINGNPSVDAQGNYSLQGFGSGQTAQKKDIFGNIIS